MVDFKKVADNMRQRKERVLSGEYRTIIAGSRKFRGEYADELVALAAKESGFNVVRVLSGRAMGIDMAGERWAKANGIPVDTYPALWDEDGRSAGFRRNERMAGKADALIAIWDGVSHGTRHMIDTAFEYGLKTYTYTVRTK